MARKEHELTSDERLIVQEIEQLADSGSGEVLRKESGAIVNSSAGTGDVSGPGSSTDNAIARYDGTGGKTLQNSSATISDTGVVTAGANAASGLDLVTYQQWQDSLAGLSAKDSVRVATTANGTFSTAFQNGATVDGITLVTGNRILIKDQTSQDQNGIYTVNASGAPTRASDANTWDELVSAFTFVEAGSTNADTGWVCTINTGGTLGIDNIAFTQFTSSGSGISSLNGLSATSQTFAVGTSGTDFAVSSASSTHTFNLPDASGTNRGVVTTGAQTIAGQKTFSSAPIVDTGTASKPAKLGASKEITSGDIDLTAEVTGVLPVANGGTNSSSALNNDRAMVSSAGAIVESAITATELGYLDGVTSNVQTQLDGKADDGDVTASGLTMNTARILGRTTASAGAIEELTKASALTFLNVEDGADVTDATNVGAAGATMNTDTDVSSNSWVLDEDTMSSDSNTKVPTQQSVKAYVDTQVASAGGITWIPIEGSMTSSTPCKYTDTDTMIIYLSNTLYVTRGLAVGIDRFLRYSGGTAQSVSVSTATGSAYTTVSGLVVRDGYMYISAYSASSSKIYRCAITDDVTSGGNWTEMTISGTALSAFSTSGLCGYGDGKFWYYKAGTGLVPYTLSGTTLTSGTAVTPTGASNDPAFTTVNETGIYNYFSSDPRIRFSAFDGTLDSTKQIKATNAGSGAMFSLGYKTGFYVHCVDSATNYTGLQLINF